MIPDLVLCGLTLAAALGCIWVILRNHNRPYYKEF